MIFIFLSVFTFLPMFIFLRTFFENYFEANVEVNFSREDLNIILLVFCGHF